MQTVQFLTKSKDGKFTQWCVTNDKKTFFDFMQYVLDSCDRPEDYILYDETNNRAGAMMDAVKRFRMRKRTFEERMAGVDTYTDTDEEVVLYGNE